MQRAPRERGGKDGVSGEGREDEGAAAAGAASRANKAILWFCCAERGESFSSTRVR
jgi:hypothetical protein